MAVTVTPLATECLPLGTTAPATTFTQLGMHYLALYRQDVTPSGGYTPALVASLPNCQQKHASHPIKLSFIPSVANVQNAQTTGGITALTSLSTGYAMRPRLNCRAPVGQYPTHNGFLYAQSPGLPNTASVTVNLTVYAYVTFYNYKGLITS